MMPLDWKDWQNFSEAEMRCRCGRCDRADMHAGFMDRLQALRNEYGKPMIVTSGFRCPEWNRAVGGGPEHVLGKAVDIAVAGKDARLLIELAVRYFPRLGVKQHGPHAGRFLHLGSAGPIEVDGFSPWIWSY